MHTSPPPPLGRTLQKIRADGRLVCGVLEDFEPFGFRDAAGGKVVGYEIDLAHELARELGVELALVVMPAASRLPALLDGTVDVLAALMSWNAQRDQEMDFSGIYGKDKNHLMVLADAGFEAADDLAQARLAVLSGTSLAQVARARFPSVQLVTYGSPEAAGDSLLARKVDAVFLKATSLAKLQRLHARVPMRVLPQVLLAPESAFAVRKGDQALLAAIDTFLQRIERDGTAQRLFDRWLGRDSIYRLEKDFVVGAADSRRGLAASA